MAKIIFAKRTLNPPFSFLTSLCFNVFFILFIILFSLLQCSHKRNNQNIEQTRVQIHHFFSQLQTKTKGDFGSEHQFHPEHRNLAQNTWLGWHLLKREIPCINHYCGIIYGYLICKICLFLLIISKKRSKLGIGPKWSSFSLKILAKNWDHEGYSLDYNEGKWTWEVWVLFFSPQTDDNNREIEGSFTRIVE